MNVELMTRVVRVVVLLLWIFGMAFLFYRVLFPRGEVIE
jgi:hypothetical protein